MMRLRSILLLAGVLLVASAIAGIAQPRLGQAAGTPTTKTITVTGNGSVTTVPDQAGFDFTVDTRATTAARDSWSAHAMPSNGLAKSSGMTVPSRYNHFSNELVMLETGLSVRR